MEKLEKGGKFKYRPVVPASVTPKPESGILEIPPSTRQAVKEVAPDQEHSRLFVPEARNYKGMDAWIHGIGAFQMTVSKRHVITKKASEDIRVLGNKFYWVVPPLHYDTFDKRGTPDIQEFALLVPYPTDADITDSMCISSPTETDMQIDF